MDPSALIFVALAVAWAVYLIPKALEHHEEGVRTRTVTRFSATMRVLARREPVNRRKARLVAARSSSSDPNGRSSAPPDLQTASLDDAPAPTLTPAQQRLRRVAAARAAQRRLRVVTLILLANLVMAGLAIGHVLAWTWCALPVAALVAWLVACRVMVRKERGIRRTPRGRIPAEGGGADESKDNTEEVAVVPADPGAEHRDEPIPGRWDPVPVTLPTYVSKPVAARSVNTIDLDSTGVWSSGRNEADSELVREANAREAGSAAGRAQRRPAVGD